jgi:hypothetical protein
MFICAVFSGTAPYFVSNAIKEIAGSLYPALYRFVFANGISLGVAEILRAKEANLI